jgi:hypothetical protein
MTDRKHTAILESDFLAPPNWRAECSCGWIGHYRDEIGEAHKDFAEHCIENGELGRNRGYRELTFDDVFLPQLKQGVSPGGFW